MDRAEYVFYKYAQNEDGRADMTTISGIAEGSQAFANLPQNQGTGTRYESNPFASFNINNVGENISDSEIKALREETNKDQYGNIIKTQKPITNKTISDLQTITDKTNLIDYGVKDAKGVNESGTGSLFFIDPVNAKAADGTSTGTSNGASTRYPTQFDTDSTKASTKPTDVKKGSKDYYEYNDKNQNV